MKLDETVEVVFKDKETDHTIRRQMTMGTLLEKTIEDIYEDLEEDCTSSGCNNESQNFCDCGPQFEDFEIIEVNPLKME